MATEVERLVVRMEANTAKFEAAMAKSSRAAYGAAAKIKKDLGGIDAAVNQAASKLPVLGGGLAAVGPAGIAASLGVLSLVGALNQARAAAAFADNLADTAKRLHVTTDALQEYRYAIRVAGGEEKGADEALEAFSVSLGKAQEGLKKSLVAFHSIGIEPPQIKSFKDADAALTEVVRRIQELPAAQRDAAIAQFGLEGLKPLIDGGLESMQALRAEAHAVGVVMDSELVRRGAEAHDQFETLSKVIDVQLKSALIDLAPVLTMLLGLVASIARGIADVVDNLRTVENQTTRGLIEKRNRLMAQINSFGPNPSPSQVSVIKANRETMAEISAEMRERFVPPPVRTPTRTLQGPAPRGGGAKSAPVDRSDQAIAQATAEELNARQGLLRVLLDQIAVGDSQAVIIEKIAALEADELKARREQRDERTRRDKSLTAAAKAEILAKSAAAGDADKQALELRTQRQLAEAARQREEDYEAFQKDIRDAYDEIAGIASAQAITAAERQRIELRNFELNRSLDRRLLEAKLTYLLSIERITPSEADARLAAFDDQTGARRGAVMAGTRSPVDQARHDAALEGAGIGAEIAAADAIEERYAAMYEAIDQMRREHTLGEEQAARAKAQINARYNEERLANASTFFGTLAQLAGSENKKLAAIGKAAAIAQATIDGFVAVQKALASAPPPFNFALAAAVGAVAAVNVAKIAGVPGFERGGTPPIGQPYLVGERGPEIRVDHRPGTILNSGVLDALNRGALSMPSARGAPTSAYLRMSIDVSGATGDREIARIVDQAARRAGHEAYALAMRDTPARMQKHHQLGSVRPG